MELSASEVAAIRVLRAGFRAKKRRAKIAFLTELAAEVAELESGPASLHGLRPETKRGAAALLRIAFPELMKERVMPLRASAACGPRGG